MTTAPLSVDFRDWVAFRAETHRDHLAIECGDERLNYADLDARVGRTAGALRALGVAEDEPLPVLAGNGVPIAVFAHAIPRAGALFMPLNARLSAGEIAYQLQDARVRFLIATPEYLDAARAAAEGAPGVQVLDATDARWEAGAYLAGPASVDPDTGHSVIYTSGTTGRPKGAVLTHGNFAWSAVASAANLGVQPDDRWLACMPLFHVGGLSILLRAAIYGTTASTRYV